MNAKQEITDLTACRAFFALWVFIYHVDLYLNFSAYLGPLAGLIRRGYLGVDGFFILSGLILARVHPELASRVLPEQPNKVTYRAPNFATALVFLGKRLARIYPLHLATILILAMILYVGFLTGTAPRDPERFGLSSLVQNLALVHGWGFSAQGDWNYPSWSVSTEWAGYLLFPVFWYVIAYFDWYVGIQFAILGFTVLGLVFVRHHYNLNLPFAAGLQRFFPEFILGVSTARLVPVFADGAPARDFAITGAIVALLSVVTGIDLLTVVGLWFVMFAFTMHADAERPPLLGRSQHLRWFGQLSYAFYMSFAVAELLISQWFRREGWTPASHGLLFAAAMLAVTLVIAILLHATIEVPGRRGADRWLERPAS